MSTEVVSGQNAVWKRLQSPQKTVSFIELASLWTGIEITLSISGYAVAAAHPALLSDLRGAFGRALMDSASPESLAGAVCDWKPPCANDVFYGRKPALKVSRHTQELPKPYVLRADRVGADLTLTVALFGFATEWVGEVRTGLVKAVRQRLDWKRLADGAFLPKDMQLEMTCRDRSFAGICDEVVPASVTLQFITPIDCKNIDPLERPDSVLSRLASRVWLLARWHDVTVDVDWAEFSANWHKLEAVAIDKGAQTISRNSNRTGQRFSETARLLDLKLNGDLTGLWPVLRIGEQVHVGRGVTAGLGRYILDVVGNAQHV